VLTDLEMLNRCLIPKAGECLYRRVGHKSIHYDSTSIATEGSYSL
jgi:hypothetical protein